MSNQREIFYKIFWTFKSCRRMFLLSKNEILDSHEIDLPMGGVRTITFPKIILSNALEDNFKKEMANLRNEIKSANSEKNIENIFENYTPLLVSYFEEKFGKSLQKLLIDFENTPRKVLWPLVRIFFVSEQKAEKIIIEFLQRYGIIGKQISTFDQLEEYIQKEAINKNLFEILNEEHVLNFLHMLTSIKDQYWTMSLKMLTNTNQVLINALHDQENYEDRLNIFQALYDHSILIRSKSESFIICQKCQPDSYEGMMHLNIPPLKTKNLICPLCADKVTYFIPYDLDNTIYEIIKSTNGLLNDALLYLLDSSGYQYSVGETLLGDIELDCVVQTQTEIIIIEVKMYKLENRQQVLSQKVKKHAGKLHQDITRINACGFNKDKELRPILLVNITDDVLLSKIKSEITDPVEVYNLDQIKELIENLPK